MSTAARAAGEAATLAEQAERYAEQYRVAKARARHYAREAADAEAIVEASSITSANSSVASAHAVVAAHGEARSLRTENITGSTRSASQAAGVAKQAAERVASAVALYRQAEAEAAEAARSGLMVSRQIVGQINLTVEASRAAAQDLSQPMAAAERIVAAAGVNGTRLETPNEQPVPRELKQPAAESPTAPRAPALAPETSPAPPAPLGRGAMREITPLSSAIDSVAATVADIMDESAPYVAATEAKPTPAPAPGIRGAEVETGRASVIEIVGWVAFSVLLVGTGIWCCARI